MKEPHLTPNGDGTLLWFGLRIKIKEKPVLNTTKDAIDKARSDAQDLHKRITAATSNDQAAIKTDFERLALDAQQVVLTLKAASQGAQPNTKPYLDDAAALLQDAANRAKDAAKLASPEFDKAKAAVVAQITDSIQRVSQAVAAKRAAQVGAKK